MNWNFSSSGIETAPVSIALAVGIAAASAGTYIILKRSPRRTLAVLRIVAMALALFLLLQPSFVRYNVSKRPALAVAVDVSDSMALSGSMAMARQFIKERKDELEKNFDVRWYSFARAATRVENEAAAFSARRGKSTDITGSLEEIRRENGESLAGILLLSDGNQTETNPGSVGAAVFPVDVRPAARPKDIAVRSVRVSDFAFKGTPIDINVGLHAMGAAGEVVTIQVKKKESAEILASKAVTINSGDETREVPLRFTPSSNDNLDCTVEALPVPGEITLSNNRASFSLEIIKDKVRVLYICGQPGPEYAFLRHRLKNDPLVELVSFVILRNPENIALVPENDLSLIPFPVHELFTRGLYTFDILILENFTYQRFGFYAEHLETIRRWVMEKGGGLLMIGGDNAFGRGGWAQTPVAAVLPVTCDTPQDVFDEALFKPRIASYENPLLQLYDDPKQNRAAWDALPELEGCQALGRKTGSEVLMLHPWKNYVVMACGESGNGRALALGANTTWRWALGSATTESYTRFWKNVVRYLSRTGGQKKLHVAFDQPEYTAGQNFNLKVRYNDDTKAGLLRGYFYEPSGARHELALQKRGAAEWTATGVFKDAGDYRFTLYDTVGGTKKILGTFIRTAGASGEKEDSALYFNEEALKKLAVSSGGEYYGAGSFSAEKLRGKTIKTATKTAKNSLALWHSPLLLATIVLLLLAEWILKKRAGMA